MNNADDIVVAAARAATPPRSQLDMLAMRVADLEARMNVMAEQNTRIVALVEQLYKAQLAMVEEVKTRMTEFVTILQRQPPTS
jgi:hypothetical protein